MQALGVGAVSYERGTLVGTGEHQGESENSWSRFEAGGQARGGGMDADHVERGEYKATSKRDFKLQWRKAGLLTSSR